MPPELLDYLSRGPVSGELFAIDERLNDTLVPIRYFAAKTASSLELDVSRRFDRAGDLAEQPLEQQLRLATGCLADMESVHDMVRLNIQGANCQAEGLGAILEAAYLWSSGETALPDVYDRAWYEGLW